MPFNSNGFFQRLFSWRKDRDAEIRILAERMDQEMDGMAQRLNAIVSGEVALKGPITSIFGTAAAPAYTFDVDSNTGMYRISADVLGFSAGGKFIELTAIPRYRFGPPLGRFAGRQSPPFGSLSLGCV